MLESLDLSSFFEEVEVASAADEAVPSEPDEEDAALEILLDPEAPAYELLTEDVEALMAEAFESFSFSDVSIEGPETQQNNREVVSLTDQDLSPFAESQSAFGSGLDLTQDWLNDAGNTSRSSRSLSSDFIGESFSSSRESNGSRRYTGNLEGLSFSDGPGRETIRATGGAEAPSLESSSSSGARMDNLALGEGDISVPSDSLLQWILNNQAELDPGIRSLFYFAPPAISARAQTTINTQPSEIQIMYTPSNREIRIALIKEGDIYYFVDPGFQKRAQYFQKGIVDRDELERVDFVESEDFSPTSPEARDFFRFFLAWWQQESQNM